MRHYRRVSLVMLIALLLTLAAVVVATALPSGNGDAQNAPVSEPPSELDSPEPAVDPGVDGVGIDFSVSERAALANMGIALREDARSAGPVDRQQAIDRANSSAAELIARSKIAPSVTARRVLFTQDGVTGGPITLGGLKDRSVWIVTVSGVEIRRVGMNPSGVESIDPSTLVPHRELNIVVDAETGEPLLEFHYR